MLYAWTLIIFSWILGFIPSFANASPEPESALSSSIEVIQEAASQRNLSDIKAALEEAWGPRLMTSNVLESMSSEALAALPRTSFKRVSESSVEISYNGGSVHVEVLDAERGEFLINGRRLSLSEFKTHSQVRSAIEHIVHKTVSLGNTGSKSGRDWGMISSVDAFMGTSVTDSILATLIDLMVAGVSSEST